jgi:hypothetical protein
MTQNADPTADFHDRTNYINVTTSKNFIETVSVAEWLWRVTQAKACLLRKTHSQEVSHRATCVGSNPTADIIFLSSFLHWRKYLFAFLHR